MYATYFKIVDHLRGSHRHSTEAHFELFRARYELHQKDDSEHLKIISVLLGAIYTATYGSSYHGPIFWAHVPDNDAARVHSKSNA